MIYLFMEIVKSRRETRLRERVKVGQMDDSIRSGCAPAQALQVFKGTPICLSASGNQRGGNSI